MSERNDALLKSQYHQAEDYFFSSISLNHTHYADRAAAYLTGVNSESLNPLIIRCTGAESDSDLRAGIGLFDAAGQLFSVAVPDDALDTIDNQLLACGLAAVYQTTAMYLVMDDFTPHHSSISAGDGAIITRTDDNLIDWVLPLESAFEGTPELTVEYRLRHQAALDRNRQFAHFSLYSENRPVCSLTLTMDHQIARLDDIGTQEAFQGRGYASALIQHALMHARLNNTKLCFLEASVQGAGLYQKAGFKNLFGYTAYQRQ
ncbi:GNAT family N-acetyltransferase [Pseudochrobactrum sp. MP213Fo]|uniref:GNAT family N-acetyltransferase n=1 Tax=Pseudochrobactrum sp. MP213Fo TaxID=3022250 RepID=UPI003BA2F125